MNYSKLYTFCVEAYSKIPYLFGKGYAFPPMTLFVELTYRCNFRCNMCQFLPILDDPRLNEKKGEELTAEEINGVVDDIPPLGLICFTGGEPLLRKDIGALVSHAAKRHKVYIVTNGVLLDAGRSEELVNGGCRSLLGPGVASVGISLEALGPAHDRIVNAPGSFEKILANVRRMVEYKKNAGKKFPLIWLKCVITSHNVAQLDDMYKLAVDTGVDMFNPISYYSMPAANRLAMDDRINTETTAGPAPGIDIPLLREQIRRLYERARNCPVQLRITPPALPREEIVAIYEGKLDLSNKACYTPWSSAALSAYGELFPCSNYSVGNIRTTPFLTLWNNRKMRDFRTVLKKKRIFGSCAACCSMVPG